MRAQTEDVFGLERPMDVIPNFVDTERFRPERDRGIRHCFSKHDERVVMHVSNFRPVKWAELAVRALARAAVATLVMVGDGPDRGACERLAQKRGIKDRVRFLGAQTDVQHLLPAADLFLLPSEYESFGLAALEAMACGVVPVVTKAGGLPELIRDGEDGVLVPDSEMDRMGSLAASLLADETRMARMSAAAREAAEGRFGREGIVGRYEAVYRGVLTP